MDPERVISSQLSGKEAALRSPPICTFPSNLSEAPSSYLTLSIRFVLSDAYVSMSREERQSLLHDSSSHSTTTGQNLSATLSAFVEIVFDNSDQRFPTSGNELILRRTIGLKKDEYSIDRRSSSKADVGNLLEAAGFSRSNPYYIVPQGRVSVFKENIARRTRSWLHEGEGEGRKGRKEGTTFNSTAESMSYQAHWFNILLVNQITTFAGTV